VPGPAAQYVHDIVEVDGLRFPTARRAYRHDGAGFAIRDDVLVSINISNLALAGDRRPERRTGNRFDWTLRWTVCPIVS
jgi:hypothetical protein